MEVESGLRALRGALLRLRFDLSGDQRESLHALRARVVEDVDGDLGKLADLGAPLLVVLGGVTGAGKSTCVNTLVGRAVVQIGVLRPTTFAPTLVVHPDDATALRGNRILPRLPRAEGLDGVPAGGERDTGVLRVVHSDALPEGLALIDAPDVDSISTANRELADSLLDAADLWLWFTTGGKYADEESMRYLRRALQRRTVLAAVLTQVLPADAAEIVADYERKLAAEGLGDVRLFVVPFTTVTDGRLPDTAIAGLRDWLLSLSDPETRLAFRRQTLEGAVAALPGEVAPLITAVEDELRSRRTLIDEVERALMQARSEFDEALDQGLPLRAEILGRWDAFVGGGQLLRLAERAGGQAREWIREVFAPSPGGREQRLEREVRAEVGDTLSNLIVQLTELTAADRVEGWERIPAGRDLLARRPELSGTGPRLRERADRMVRGWQETVGELIATRGAERRTTARWVSGALNIGATGLILGVLGHTGGLTGAEAGIAAAAGAANQALLVRLLGEANLRWLLARAREDLSARFLELINAEARRATGAVEAAAPARGDLDALRDALHGLQAVRQ